MRALVIQHDHVSPPGPLADRLTDHGYAIELHEVVPEHAFHLPGVDPAFPPLTDFDIVVPMGAPWSTYDHDLIGTWVVPEIEALEECDRAGVPVLGVCFGGQLLAAAHGGTVSRSPHPEMGWVSVDSDDDLIPRGDWFEWHYDRWTLPPGASEVARNYAASQAFVLRRNLAVQFHPEVTSDMLQGWYDNGGRAALQRGGHDPDALLAATRARETGARDRAHRLIDNFVTRIARKDR